MTTSTPPTNPTPINFETAGWNLRRHESVVAIMKSHFLEIGLCDPTGSARQPIRLFLVQSYDCLVHRCATATGPHDGAAIRDLALAGRLSQDFVAWATEMIAWAATFATDGEGEEEDHRNMAAFGQRFPRPDPTKAPWDETFGLLVQTRKRFECSRCRIKLGRAAIQSGCQGWQTKTANQETQGGGSDSSESGCQGWQVKPADQETQAGGSDSSEGQDEEENIV